MTNEELAIRVKAGETGLMPVLWEQVKLYAFKRANAFYRFQNCRCTEMGVEIEDLEQEAYIAICKAAEKFKAEKGVKFLTYAEYRLKAGFYAAAKLKNCGDRYHETKFDDVIVYSSGDGTDLTLSDTLADSRAEDSILDIAEHDHRRDRQAKLKAAFDSALSQLRYGQRETVTECLLVGLPISEYARRKGITRQAAHLTASRAKRKLMANAELAAYAKGG